MGWLISLNPKQKGWRPVYITPLPSHLLSFRTQAGGSSLLAPWGPLSLGDAGEALFSCLLSVA